MYFHNFRLPNSVGSVPDIFLLPDDDTVASYPPAGNTLKDEKNNNSTTHRKVHPMRGNKQYFHLPKSKCFNECKLPISEGRSPRKRFSAENQ